MNIMTVVYLITGRLILGHQMVRYVRCKGVIDHIYKYIYIYIYIYIEVNSYPPNKPILKHICTKEHVFF